jgi:ribosomal protein S18 acetylase RimI-like enzyme
MLNFIEVKTASDITEVVNLANKIWNEHYVAIIGQQQIDYMLNYFQSPTAIAKQIADGMLYFMVSNDKHNIAYYAIHLCNQSNDIKINKLYVMQEQQGQGIGRDIIAMIQTYAMAQNRDKMCLTVNKNNQKSIQFYKKMGFNIIGNVIQDIGKGFVMDDFIMQKKLLYRK